MKPAIIRDRTLDWFERMMNSPWLDRGCYFVIGAAALYFLPLILSTFLNR